MEGEGVPIMVTIQTWDFDFSYKSPRLSLLLRTYIAFIYRGYLRVKGVAQMEGEGVPIMVTIHTWGTLVDFSYRSLRL